MDRVRTLVERYYSTAGGELKVGGVPVTALAAEYGTPLFIYDRGVLDAKYDLLRTALPPEFDIYYSIKANPSLKLLKHFLSRGCGFEIASAGEFHQALKAACPANRIVFAGPGKTEAELEYVLQGGIGEIHLESLREAKCVAACARRSRMTASVAIRINPSEEAQGGAMRMGGKAAPFGVDEECLDSLLDFVLSEASLRLRGIHLFAGTQILDAELLLNQYHKGLDIARHVAKRLGSPLRTVDFGGGLGIPYFPQERELDTSKLHNGLESIWTCVRSEDGFAGTRFMVEPGRYLVGEAGIYVTRIVDLKTSRGKKFIITDGGMNHHLAASGNLGQTIKRNFPLALLNKIDKPCTDTVDVVGPLCTPLDVLGRAVTLPQAAEGDLLGVFQSGAYARTASPTGFLSHPTPPEVWVDHGRYELIRRRGTYDDYLQDQVPESAAE